MKIKTKVYRAQCSISLSGMDMNCPLCGTLVKSGESHKCELGEPKLTEVAKAKLHGYLVAAANEVSYAITLRDDYDVGGYINLEFIQEELRHKSGHD